MMKKLISINVGGSSSNDHQKSTKQDTVHRAGGRAYDGSLAEKRVINLNDYPRSRGELVIPMYPFAVAQY